MLKLAECQRASVELVQLISRVKKRTNFAGALSSLKDDDLFSASISSMLNDFGYAVFDKKENIASGSSSEAFASTPMT